jgi:cellobiose-specific phosphotransferase system component IIB
MNEKQLKQKYEQGLDKLDLTDSEREAFDHDAKRSLIDLDTYQETDTFSLQGYKLSKVMDDIVLAQYVDLSNDGRSVIRNGIHIPLSQVKRTWRLARVVLVGPQCKYTSPGDVVCFPDDKGIKVDNLRVVGYVRYLSGLRRR